MYEQCALYCGERGLKFRPGITLLLEEQMRKEK